MSTTNIPAPETILNAKATSPSNNKQEVEEWEEEEEQEEQGEGLPEPNASYNIPQSSALLHSSKFITGAGVVIFHRRSKKVVLVRDEREDQRWFGYFLPKGRKDIGESLEQAACREGEEESGFPNRLLPVPVTTRAPSKNLQRQVLSTEPIYMHSYAIPRGRSWHEGGVYSVFWYVCEVTDEDLETVQAAQQMKDMNINSLMDKVELAKEDGKRFTDFHELRYKSELFDYDTAKVLIANSIDATVFGTVLSTAIELVQYLDTIESHLSSNSAEG